LKFRTELAISESDIKINYGDGIIFLGSCFADNIGSKLIQHKLKVLSNPYGTIYNPLILCKLLMHTIDNKTFSSEDLSYYNQLYFHLDLHHTFASEEEHIFLKKYVEAKENLLQFIKNGKILFLTLGTAIGHQLIETGEMVGNCHKMPASLFNKKNISTHEITSSLGKTIAALKKLNPNLEIILTVSPVRHIKDGIIQNSRSKSRLISSVEEIIATNDSIHYFPAYELIMDDLRDYRFYGEDLVHPNELAIKYVWDKFVSTHMSQESLVLLKQIEKINAATDHRAFNPNSEQHQKFLLKTIDQMDKVELNLKDKVFEKERAEILSLLK